jgi:hypothetical protein
MTPRGRGPRRSQGHNQQFLPLGKATYFGLYLDSPTANEISRKRWTEWRDELDQLRAQLRAVNQPLPQKLERLVKLFSRKRAIDLVN